MTTMRFGVDWDKVSKEVKATMRRLVVEGNEYAASGQRGRPVITPHGNMIYAAPNGVLEGTFGILTEGAQGKFFIQPVALPQVVRLVEANLRAGTEDRASVESLLELLGETA